MKKITTVSKKQDMKALLTILNRRAVWFVIGRKVIWKLDGEASTCAPEHEDRVGRTYHCIKGAH